MKRLSHEEFLKILKEKNPTIILIGDTIYKNRKTLFKCKCNICFHEWETNAGNLIDGHHCRKCNKTYKPTNEEFIQEMKEINTNIKILGEYINARTPILCKCLKCGYDKWEPVPYSIKNGGGCPVCYGRVAIPYENDVYTLRKDLLKYLVDEKDAIGVLPNSLKLTEMKCPNCNYIKKMKFRYLNNNGFSCPKCGDGFSYPEKILRTFLNKLNIDFKTQKTFKWSQNKRYDFYIPSLKCIIETHGKQHYNNGFESLSGKSLQEEQSNDQLKECLAKENGIEHYISLDCRKSELEWIKNSILNSELNELFDLSNIDWNECENFYNQSIQLQILEEWNKTNSISCIVKTLNISDTTIRLYLKNLTALGLCNYNPKQSSDKANFMKTFVPYTTRYLICVETRRIFNGFLECKNFLANNLDIECKIDTRKIKKSCETGEEVYGLHFNYIDIKQKGNTQQ